MKGALDDVRPLEECIMLTEHGEVAYKTISFGELPANVLEFDMAVPDFQLVCVTCTRPFERPQEPILLPCSHVVHNR